MMSFTIAKDRTEIRPAKQLVFEGNADKKEVAEALSMLKGIAHAAVWCNFNPKRAEEDAYIEILDHLICRMTRILSHYKPLILRLFCLIKYPMKWIG